MPERYAELNLYYGLCPEAALTERGLDVVHEGRLDFDFDKADQRLKDWYFTAMRVVKTHLSEGRVAVGYSNGVAETDTDAEKLIAYAEANIPNAHSVIKLKECTHGDIMFLRLIRFDGYTEDRREELLESMKRSGYRPKSRYISDRHDSDPERLWKEALKFY